ncbi:Tripeptidyl-peptidase 1 [Dissostichus eleginoides]|uniref:Tripeptidyl-peptidase 1 n=1 Tax=Dissostichus eleginoides TaxID=100907 RepID=A0AAD9BJ74_DISEL|nr:Tripeptidyl-peptidase 1 [Dissostichus eleginoides]
MAEDMADGNAVFQPKLVKDIGLSSNEGSFCDYIPETASSSDGSSANEDCPPDSEANNDWDHLIATIRDSKPPHVKRTTFISSAERHRPFPLRLELYESLLILQGVKDQELYYVPPQDYNLLRWVNLHHKNISPILLLTIKKPHPLGLPKHHNMSSCCH